MIAALRRLRYDHWAWVHAKVVLFFCGYLYFAQTPPSHLEELGAFLTDVVAIFMMVGSVVSVVGLVISTSEEMVRTVRGLEIERFGLGIALCGPLTYTVVQVALVNDFEGAVTRAFFAYALAAFIAARGAVIHRAISRRR